MASPSQRIFVFDSPRTCSHLMFKLFDDHPQLFQVRHPWLPMAFAPGRIQLKLKCNSAAQEVHANFEALRPPSVQANWTREDGLKLLSREIELAETKGKIPIMKEHVALIFDHDFVLQVLRNESSPYRQPEGPACSTNPLFIPDDMMKTLTPVFLIRNPLLFVLSNWKIHQPFKEDPWDEHNAMLASHRWVRIVFDYFREQGLRDPIVVDAGDVVYHSAAFAPAFCKKLGIETQWQEVWDSSITEEQRNGQDPWNQALHNIRASGGVIRSGTPDSELTLEDEYKKWEAEYGEEIATGLANLVKDDMPEYLYLRKYKLKLDS